MVIEEKDKKTQQGQPQDSGGNQQQPETYQDAYWSWVNTSLQQHKDAVEKAGNKLTTASEAVDPAKEALKAARENQLSFRRALVNESKPVRKENDETMARRAALIKSGGDLLSALAVGINAYGKNGAGVVPTLAENSPLKELDKLNRLQKEYAKRKEAWESIEKKLRDDEMSAKTTEASEAYQEAVNKMKLAQAAYDKKLTGYNDAYQSIQEYIGDMALEETRLKNRLQLKRTPSASGGSGKANRTISDQKAEQEAENNRIKAERTIAQNEFKTDGELRKWDTAKRAEVDKYIREGYSAYEAIDMVTSGKKPEAKRKAQKDAKDAQEAAEGFKVMYDSAIAKGFTPEQAAQAAQNVINNMYPHLTLGYPYK